MRPIAGKHGAKDGMGDSLFRTAYDLTSITKAAPCSAISLPSTYSIAHEVEKVKDLYAGAF